MYLKKPKPIRRIRLLVATREKVGVPSHWQVFDALLGCKRFAESFFLTEDQCNALAYNFFDTILNTIGDQCILSAIGQLCDSCRDQSTIVLLGVEHGTMTARTFTKRLTDMGAITWNGGDQAIPRIFDFRYR
jgi:hypothetical protein